MSIWDNSTGCNTVCMIIDNYIWWLLISMEFVLHNGLDCAVVFVRVRQQMGKRWLWVHSFSGIYSLDRFSCWAGNRQSEWKVNVKGQWQGSDTIKFSRLMTKPTKWHVRPAKTRISMGICPDCSESSLSAWGKLGSLLTIERIAKILIRLGGCPGWSESSLGSHAILLVLSWGGSINVDIQNTPSNQCLGKNRNIRKRQYKHNACGELGRWTRTMSSTIIKGDKTNKQTNTWWTTTDPSQWNYPLDYWGAQS